MAVTWRRYQFIGQLPIFIDDKPNLSVLEMRSLCRRLIAEQKKRTWINSDRLSAVDVRINP